MRSPARPGHQYLVSPFEPRCSAQHRRSLSRWSPPTTECCCGHSGGAQRRRDRTPTPAIRESTSSGSAHRAPGRTSPIPGPRATPSIAPSSPAPRSCWHPVRSGAAPCSHPAPFDEHGYLVNPKTLRRTPIPHGPLDDLGPQIIWTGAAEISLNVGRGDHWTPCEGAPRRHRDLEPADAQVAPRPRAPIQLIYDAAAVWSGSSCSRSPETGTSSPTAAERPQGPRGSAGTHQPIASLRRALLGLRTFRTSSARRVSHLLLTATDEQQRSADRCGPDPKSKRGVRGHRTGGVPAALPPSATAGCRATMS